MLACHAAAALRRVEQPTPEGARRRTEPRLLARAGVRPCGRAGQAVEVNFLGSYIARNRAPHRQLASAWRCGAYVGVRRQSSAGHPAAPPRHSGARRPARGGPSWLRRALWRTHRGVQPGGIPVPAAAHSQVGGAPADRRAAPVDLRHHPCPRPYTPGTRAGRGRSLVQPAVHRRADTHHNKRGGAVTPSSAAPVWGLPEAAALDRAAAALLRVQRPGGDWEDEMVWCTMVTSQWVMVQRIVNRTVAAERREGII